ncbi:MAG: hypothetical protein ABUL66_01050 [Verrucomicrobiota bacterium]
MKILSSIMAAATLFLSGCGDSSKPGTVANNVSNVVTAPVNYLGAVVEAKKHSEKVIDVAYLTQAIQMFNVQEGRYPKTLQELVPTYVAKLPEPPFGTKLAYDATTGTVKVVKQ